MQSKRQILSLHRQWVKELKRISDYYSEKLYKELIEFVKFYDSLCSQKFPLSKFKTSLKEKIDELEKIILDIIYDSLEETYSITLSYLRKMYGHIPNKKIDLDNLTFHKDGIKLEDRVHNHCKEWFKTLTENYQEDTIIPSEKVKKVFSYQLIKIIDTEVFAVGNNLTHQKMIGLCELAEIVVGDSCPECAEMEEGPIPVDEIIIPPYHPNCQCTVVYWGETDNNDDIEDLELDDDETI